MLPVRLTGAILCAVVGKPIGHSKSPLIHRLFAEQFGFPLQYERIEVAPGALARTLEGLRASGCRGVNVTVPLKEEAASIAQERTADVTLAGAANTLWWTERNLLAAANTDGTGLINDLTRNLGVTLEGRNILLLGAGGAAAGVISPLLAANPAALRVMNRDHARAEALVARFQALGPIAVMMPNGLRTGAFDLIINATSAGLTLEAPTFPVWTVADSTYCYDMFYAAVETPFIRRSRKSGAARASDGVGMLVEQAAAAFQLWHGMRPNTAPVLAVLRA